MSENGTEEASPKRLREARERGEVWQSKELTGGVVLLAVAGALNSLGDTFLAEHLGSFEAVFRAAHSAELSSRTASDVFVSTLARIASRVALPLIVLAAASAALGTLLQTRPLFAPKAVGFKLERVNPVAGFKRIFSTKQLIEVARSLVKVLALAWALWPVLSEVVVQAAPHVNSSSTSALLHAGHLTTKLMFRAGAVLVALGILDAFYQRWRFHREHRMTKDEVKREHKESEGDPTTKHQRDRMRREILEHNTLEQVRRASVLVVNPQHYAIALHYDVDDNADSDRAPEVLAKGIDDLARKMMQVARELGIPIQRDITLAHALYALEPGEEIPAKLFDAVAAVLHAAWAESAESQQQAPSHEKT